MDRFIAFIWDADRRDLMRQVSRWFTEVRATSPNWTPVYDIDGLLVIALPDSRGILPVCCMSPDTGVVLGSIFATDESKPKPLKQLSAEAVARVGSTKGEELIRSFWGSFVGILPGDSPGTAHVVRDPCGAIGCYYTRSKSVTLLCSFPDDIAELSGIVWSIDWCSIQAFLVSNYLINPRTGLRELTEVMPGHRVTYKHEAAPVSAPIWNPIKIAQNAVSPLFSAACEEFRAVAETCIAGWSQNAGDILIRLSGGLDSSIVAALARNSSGSAVTGLHLVARSYEAYELELARQVAAHLDIRLEERVFDGDLVSFRGASAGPRVARPSKQFLGSEADGKLLEVCETTRSHSVFSGHGGDAIFVQRAIAGDTVADFLRSRGSKADLAAVAYDIAALLETSVWHVAGKAVSSILGRRRWDPDASVKEGRATACRDFASKAFFAFSPGAISSAWLEEARDLPPCKAEQVRSLLALRNYHAVRGHAIKCRSLHPLISQPLIELSLRTPAHLFSTGGIDRALEREAFRDLIPSTVARRQHKGFVNHSVIASIVSDLEYVRELILDGRCADNGLLDRAKVDRLLSEEHLLEGKSFEAVMNLIAVESWLNSWMQ